MIRFITLTLLASAWLPLAAAEDIIVTRHFTGLWDQANHESQGINLQIVHQESGNKVGVAYWFTYGSDEESAWFVGIGPVVENRVEMVLYESSDVGFLEPNDPASDPVNPVGTMVMEFTSCDQGDVEFETDLVGIGSGSFPVHRITDVHNTVCSGGISDDTPSDAPVTEQRIALTPARAGINGSGHADFEERPDRTEFSVEAEDIANGSYRIFVGGVDRGELVVNLGVGETEYRSPVEAGKLPLTFDPRGRVIEVHDGQGAVLTSGDSSLGDGDCTVDCDDDSDLDWGTVDIEVGLNNPGVYPLASGDAKLEPRPDRADFSVEIEDVPVGSYDLRVGGDIVATIQAAMDVDGTVRGEVEFRNPVEPGKVLLDFDPRGQQIDVLEGGTVVLGVLFPNT